MKTKKPFEKAIKHLASTDSEVQTYLNSTNKHRGCCVALAQLFLDDPHDDDDYYRNYFDSIFKEDAREYWFQSGYGYYFDGELTESIEESYTSRVIALQLAQILYDEGQTF